jgi:2-oxoglutarate ferredoxin oxidoreductase subunit gamma
MNLRIAGFGGQGVAAAGNLLGHAAVLCGRNALQSQSYGSEARGGACRSDVTIEEDEVLELAPGSQDVLIALSQPALDRYVPELEDDGILVYESDLVCLEAKRPRSFGLPATAIALDVAGGELAANVVLLAFAVGLTGVVTLESLRRAIERDLPAAKQEMNMRALDEGHRRALLETGG